jgi:alkylation response protein AidB-like acyl-CoA dehydrogenase
MKRTLYDADHESFRGAVRQWLAAEVIPRMDEFAEARLIARDVWLSAGKQGLLSLEIPEEYGGGEAGDYRFNSVLMEELAKVSLGLASSISIHYDVIAPYLVTLGTEDQKLEWLPRFASGEVVSAIGMTEPSAGSDLGNLRTTALRDGSDWRLDGSKTFITNGSSADLVVVAARTDPDAGSRGITLFLVDASTTGFTRGRKLDKVGQPESDTAELFFDDVRLPAAAVLGEVDRGFVHMMRHLPQERIGTAVCNLAHVGQIFDETLGYVRERKAFGKPIGSLQHNAFRIAELATSLDVSRAYVDAAVVQHTVGELGPIDAAKAKWWAAEVQNQVLDACVQLFGGYGYMREYRVARAWMDARVSKIWAGTNEIMKHIISKDLGL